MNVSNIMENDVHNTMLNDVHTIALTCLTDLVDELLEYICCLRTLGYKDIINLSSTCRRFFNVTHSNKIWSEKWKSRWPTFVLNVEMNDHRRLFKDTILIERCLVKKLSSLSVTAFDYIEVPYRFLREFDEIHNGNEETLHAVNELLYLLASERGGRGDLNQRYYAHKVYNYIYHQKLKNVWERLLNLSSEVDNVRDLEQGALLISQWCNPMLRVCSDDISHKIDTITSLVKDKLQAHCNDKIAVVEAINKVLYNELEFKDNTENYYDINNSFIDKVLLTKKGIPITLAVLYIAVAKRLGLDIQGVNFPGHFLIRLMIEKAEGKTEPLYIDAFHKGEMMDEQRCIGRLLSNIQLIRLTYWSSEMLFQVANNRKIFIRMVGNIINVLKEIVVMNSRNLSSLQAAHELMAILAPHDTNNHLILSKIGEHLRLDVELDSNNTTTPKRRSLAEHSEVKYKVGMLMKHKRYNYACVVYGWDCVCRMDDTWKAQMNVHRLDNEDNQPFYHVLAHDGSSRYAAQENLVPAEDGCGQISHPEVGKYFKSFNGTSYVLTEKLRETYPED